MDRKEPRFSATYNGFDVHCAVRVEAGDDERRERLVRYCARPPFAIERIEVMKDGRVAYRVKTPRRGRPNRGMRPVESHRARRSNAQNGEEGGGRGGGRAPRARGTTAR